MNPSDSELIQLLSVFGIVAVLLCLPACLRVWKIWQTKDRAANDSVYCPYDIGEY